MVRFGMGQNSARTIDGNRHVGSSLDSFLEEEGMLEECTTTAVKRVLARQIERALQQRGLTKSVMAKAMRTSRPARALLRVIEREPEAAKRALGG